MTATRTHIDAAWLENHKWMLRSSDDGVSYGGFRWPALGEWATAPDWNDRAECGGGFHGNAQEAHGYGFDYARIELHETRGPRIVVDGDKIKVRESRIVALGTDIPDEAFVRCGFRAIRDDAKYVVACGEYAVVLSGTPIITAESGSVVETYGTSALTITAKNGSKVRTCGTGAPTITAEIGSLVETYAASAPNITAKNGSKVRTCGTSAPTITAKRGSRVTTHGTSAPTITADRGSIVRSYAASAPTITAEDGAVIEQYGTGKVTIIKARSTK